VKVNDLFLLGSDGLTGMLEDPELHEVMKRADLMPQEQVDQLINEANRHGGLDNITAIEVRIDAIDYPNDDETTQATPAPGRRR